jgi:hypothetical protein
MSGSGLKTDALPGLEILDQQIRDSLRHHLGRLQRRLIFAGIGARASAWRSRPD